MRNVNLAVKGNILTITCDISEKGQPSASGKTQVIATTQGNQPVPGTGGKSGVNLKLGLNLYR